MSDWLLPLQVIINEALNYDLASQKQLDELVGKVLVLDVTEPTLAFTLHFEKGGFVFLSAGLTSPCDAKVSGKASDLFAVMRAEDRTAAMMAHEITIHGDTRTFFAIQTLMSGVNIDWEMALGDRIGDMAAHVVADGLRFLGSMVRTQSRSFVQTSHNFLREESGWFVQNSLWQLHERQIQKVRQDSERLSLKTERLQQKIAQLQAEREQ